MGASERESCRRFMKEQALLACMCCFSFHFYVFNVRFVLIKTEGVGTNLLCGSR